MGFYDTNDPSIVAGLVFLSLLALLAVWANWRALAAQPGRAQGRQLGRLLDRAASALFLLVGLWFLVLAALAL